MEYVSRSQLEDLEDAILEYDFNARVRNEYSGRGMFGEKCISFVVPSVRDGFKLAAVMAEHWPAQQVREMMEAVTTDSLGRDVIVYFPGWQAEGDNEE